MPETVHTLVQIPQSAEVLFTDVNGGLPGPVSVASAPVPVTFVLTNIYLLVKEKGA